MTDRTKLRLTAEAQSDMPSEIVLALIDQLTAAEVAREGYRQEAERLRAHATQPPAELDRGAGDASRVGPDLAELRRLAETLREENRLLAAKVERVRALHYRRPDFVAYGQTEFPDLCGRCRMAWPCPTIRALDEETQA